MKRTSKKDRASQEATAGEANSDAVLFAFLVDLSSILIKCDYTVGQFSGVARLAFIEAASRLSRLQNGRVNQSRVATITGLTRGEVRRAYAVGGPSMAAQRRAQHRALRVVEGWRSDPDFTSKRGKPRVLRLLGGGTAFSDLVRRYSGDIPPKAILTELLRMGLTTLRTNAVSLKSVPASSANSSQITRSFVSALNSVVGEMGDPEVTPLRVQIRELQNTTDDLSTKIFRRRTQENIKSFVTAMNEASRLEATKSGSDGNTEMHLTRISVVVSESKILKRRKKQLMHR